VDGSLGRELHACPSTLDGVYWFRDDDVVDGEALFTTFEDLPSGGNFYLIAADTLDQGVGRVRGWRVHVGTDPTAR
jgi:hypothetical protein